MIQRVFSVLWLLCLFPFSAPAQSVYQKTVSTYTNAVQKQHNLFKEDWKAANNIYTKAIGFYSDKYKTSGNSKAVSDLAKETARFQKQKRVPSPYPDNVPFVVLQIQYKYHQKLQAPRIRRDKAILKLTQKHAQTMDLFYRAMMKRDKMKEAMIVGSDQEKAVAEAQKVAARIKQTEALAPPKPPKRVRVVTRVVPPSSMAMSLVLHYAFEDAALPTGKLVSTTIVPNGKIKGGCNFGASSHISTGKLVLGSADNWTFAAWVKPSNLREGMLFYNGDYGKNGFGLCAYGMRWTILYGGKGGGSHGCAQGKLNTWQHVIVTRNAEKLSLYLNGEPGGTVDAKPNPPIGETTFGGAMTYGEIKGEWYSGLADEIMLFKKAISAEEAKALYGASGGN